METNVLLKQTIYKYVLFYLIGTFVMPFFDENLNDS